MYVKKLWDGRTHIHIHVLILILSIAVWRMFDSCLFMDQMNSFYYYKQEFISYRTMWRCLQISMFLWVPSISILVVSVKRDISVNTFLISELANCMQLTKRWSEWTAWSEEALFWEIKSTSIGGECFHEVSSSPHVLPRSMFIHVFGRTGKPRDVAKSLNEQNYEANTDFDGTTIHGPSPLLAVQVLLVQVCV